jgi:hypothetical protein
MLILGIDPGVGKTGFALVSQGSLFKHKTVIGNEAVAYMKNLWKIYRFDRCVIERPRTGVLYARHFTKKNAILSEAGKIKLAQNIGQNIQLTKDLVAELERLGVKVKQVPPKNKATKWRPEFWANVFQWKSRLPSEHIRDASVIAKGWESWAGWNLMSAAGRV